MVVGIAESAFTLADALLAALGARLAEAADVVVAPMVGAIWAPRQAASFVQVGSVRTHSAFLLAEA